MTSSVSTAVATSRCRLCGNPRLESIIDLGLQALGGLFPRPSDPPVPREPLELVRCVPESNHHCGLVQLRHSCDPCVMYGLGYGYRSSLNASMVGHLHGIVDGLRRRVALAPGDLVIDIGSNDGTTLGFYPRGEATLLGVDPTAAKFRSHYRDDIAVIDDFFSARLVQKQFPGRKAKIITSIAMIYDLEEPLGFVREIADLLDDEGVWFFEQSHLPLLLAANTYDTICHEHLEYYALEQIRYMLERSGLRILSAETNDVNGGSIAVTACKVESLHATDPGVELLLEVERNARLSEPETWDRFRRDVEAHRDELTALVDSLRAEGKSVYGYGASTKGNVLLQYCGFGPDDIVAIGEVNADKFGCVTPGTAIPIIDEKEARTRRPDVLLVLPWHFRDFIVEKERPFLESGGKLLFPLPKVEFVGA
ncbi:MAG: class I SAM-dependent methyltransferase [Thermoanaerobaculia bacterium]